uniref:HTH psq-type domain-containing protein n=1 Tax=Tetranychus urticae TaxID=32264 RepID=T1JXP4_TETUR
MLEGGAIKEIIYIIAVGEDENKVARKYRITRQAAKYIWNNKEAFLQKVADGISLKRKTVKESPFSPIDDNLNLLIRDLSDDGYPINEKYIMLMAKEIASEMKIDGF